jgi:hypothetical protein
MRSLSLFAAVLIASLAAAAHADPSRPTQTYKWVDAHGVVHYGDRIPPEAATRERAVLNEQGVPVRQLEAQKTPEQIQAEELRQTELARLRQHDQFLLTTYTSTRDIEQLRDLRLDQIEGQVRAAMLYVESLENRLSTLQARAFVFKPYNTKPGAKRMPDELAEDLVRTLSEVRAQRTALESKRAEKEKVRQAFDADIARYREIHVVRASR